MSGGRVALLMVLAASSGCASLAGLTSGDADGSADAHRSGDAHSGGTGDARVDTGSHPLHDAGTDVNAPETNVPRTCTPGDASLNHDAGTYCSHASVSHNTGTFLCSDFDEGDASFPGPAFNVEHVSPGASIGRDTCVWVSPTGAALIRTPSLAADASASAYLGWSGTVNAYALDLSFDLVSGASPSDVTVTVARMTYRTWGLQLVVGPGVGASSLAQFDLRDAGESDAGVLVVLPVIPPGRTHVALHVELVRADGGSAIYSASLSSVLDAGGVVSAPFQCDEGCGTASFQIGAVEVHGPAGAWSADIDNASYSAR